MLRPAKRPQIYRDVPKLLALPSLHMSLTMPLVMFARTPEQPPVMIRVTISVAKLFASA